MRVDEPSPPAPSTALFGHHCAECHCWTEAYWTEVEGRLVAVEVPGPEHLRGCLNWEGRTA
jgi:hypothetical protein